MSVTVPRPAGPGDGGFTALVPVLHRTDTGPRHNSDCIGLSAKLRDPSGKVVFVSAGRTVFRTVFEVDTTTGEIVEIRSTSLKTGDYAATVCRAVGTGYWVLGAQAAG